MFEIREKYSFYYGKDRVSSDGRATDKTVGHGFESRTYPLFFSFLLNPKGEEKNEQSTKQVAGVSQTEFGNYINMCWGSWSHSDFSNSSESYAKSVTVVRKSEGE